MVVEKRITSPLMEPSKVEKIFEVDRHIGITKHNFTFLSNFPDLIFSQDAQHQV